MGAENTYLNDSVDATENGNLMWIRGDLNNQFIDMMLDSGATTSCIASRCVNASPWLKGLPRKLYHGRGLFDVNGKPLNTAFEIQTSLKIGNPQLSFDVKFVVVDNLPYSCILGLIFCRNSTSGGLITKGDA